MKGINKFFLIPVFGLMLALWSLPLQAQEHGTENDQHEATESHENSGPCGDHEEGEYDPVSTVLHHIADANEFHVWKGVSIPLPCILYAPDQGWTFFFSNKLHHGQQAFDGYVLNHGRVNRISDPSFPKGEQHLECVTTHMETNAAGKDSEVGYALYHGNEYKLDKPSTLGGSFLGAEITSFYDFSITKSVFTMLLASFLLIFIFLGVAKGYKKNEGKAPSGIQSFMEPFFVFMRDEVTKPMIGEKHYERFQPFIMTLFFFILFVNLLGLVPFFPGSGNVTGNIAVTMTLAVFAFFVTNLNGNANYWKHILWMPGVPIFVKPILTIVEVLGIFIKPFSLMIRLFANISAGHIIILSLIGLIFVFGNNGESLGGATTGVIMGGLFTAFMNLIELLVAFLQAFIFAILTSSYIGAAIEEHH